MSEIFDRSKKPQVQILRCYAREKRMMERLVFEADGKTVMGKPPSESASCICRMDRHLRQIKFRAPKCTYFVGALSLGSPDIMVWISEKSDEAELFSEIATHSDRVVGILAPVVLERRLMSVIESRWKDTKTRGGTLFGELFSANGELGNHDSRLRIALAIGLFSSEAFEEMRYIVKIRNLFAHEPGAKDFGARPIRDFIPHLKIIDRFPAPLTAESSGTLTPGIELSEAENALSGTFVGGSGISDTKTLRNRFLRSVEVFSILLLYEEMRPSRARPYF